MEWDERLLSRTRAYEIAGSWPVELPVLVRRNSIGCGKCHRPIMTTFISHVTPDAIVSAVLRHAVTHHNQATGGSSSGSGHGAAGEAGGAGETACRDSARGDNCGGGDPADRHGDQAADPARSRGLAGGGDR